MHYCDNCDRQFSNPTCPRCGGAPQAASTSTFVTDLPSTVDDVTDEQVERASMPSLSSLIKAGLRRGLIKPVQDYASQARHGT